MNRIIIAILATLLQAVVTTASAYRLQTKVTPEGAGTVYPDEETCTEGYSVNLSAYSNQGFVFTGWYEGEKLLSTSSSFSYTMPARDVVLTARYEFDPEAPADPDPTTTEYFFKVLARPEEAGSFNVDNTRQNGGSSMHLYAYTKEGFVFRHWENEKGRILSTNQDFNYVMPNSNTTIYGVFDYNPTPPENPGKNAWNSTTGEVIVDDFTPGRLGYVIYDAIDGSNRDDVTSIIVSGEMSDYDFGFANDYDNCTLLDLSRVTGITEIPSWAFDNTALEKVLLPDGIERIGDRAFSGCQRLSSLTLCSMNPPALGENVFRGVPEGLIVYVPTAAMERYMYDENWQNFTILPLEGNVRSLTVTMPETAGLADYAKMTLQLINVDNGQTSSYTTTGKRSYTFGGIPVQTRWTVTMSNQRGDEFGRIENVIVGDEDVIVTFPSLKKVSNVSLTVVTPDGVNVTDNATVSWYSREGAFLSEGPRLNSVTYGEELLYSIKLSGDLRYQYQEQQRIKIVADAQLSATLQPIPKVTVTGCVKSEYGILSGAEVALTQWANGQYSRTATTKTAQDGTFTFTAIDDSSKLVVSSPRFRDVVIQRARFGADTDLGTLTMDRVTGIVVVADTRTQAIGSETTFPTVTGSIGYSLYNVTTGRQVEDMVVQGRSIIIPSEAKAGDRMTLTVTELSGNYLPASADFAIADNDTARVQLTMQELGGIESSFEQSANTENEVLLYDGDGNLYGHADYSAKKATFAHLSAGIYTLVAIGKSLQRGNLLRLADFAKTGMREGTDYLQAQVAVADGETVAQAFATIPLFDESLFNYTSSDSYVQVNKLSVATGQYVTLSCRTYFKEEYDNAIDNINIIVDLPENCQLIDNSLIVGNAASPYTVEEGRVIVPLTREQRSERIRLCVVPVAGGTYRLSTSVLFDYEGERIQSLGSVYFQTSSMTISVPSSTCQKSVLVSGKAPRQASVEVFDNGTLVAQTDALKNGQWKVSCPLTDVYNLSEHRISAKIHEESGLVLQTESKTVTYDREAVEPLDVTMTFYNAWMKKNISVFYNLKAGVASPSSYSFYHATPITFVANLSNNDPSAVNSVYIHVYTSDEGVTTLKASYDTNLNRWVAVQEFAPGYLPVSVSVSVDYISSLAFDDFYERQLIGQTEEELSLNQEIYKELELLYEKLDEEIRDNHFDPQIVNAIIEKIIQLENSIYGFDKGTPDSSIVNKVNKAQSIDEIIAIIETIDSRFNSLSVNYSNSEISIPSFNFGNGLLSPNVKFVGCGSIPVSETPELYLRDYMNCFFSGEWNDVDFSNVSNGIVTISNQNGGKVLLDFRDIFNNPADGYGNLDTESIFMERITAYMEEFTNKGIDIEALFMQSIISFRQNVNNYHYALSAIPYVESQEGRSVSNNARHAGFVDGIKAAWNSKWGVGLRGTFKWGGIGLTVVDNGLAINNAVNNDKEWDNTIRKIESVCGGVGDKLKQMAENQQKKDASDAKVLLTTKAIISGLAIGTAFCGPGFIVVGVGLKICSWALGDANKRKVEKSRQLRQQLIERMKEECCPNGQCDDDDDDEPDPDEEPPVQPVQPILDPSGFVYEGVTSNRLEGVTATVFYKAQTEDMYGDIQETVEKWNAEDYGQVNPQITDSEGKYAWDVPQGQWMVKFEKEGYETAYSEWLPVPPPQLEVNIAMKQNVQPTVKAARAYEEAVEVEFDKYMMPQHLTTDNISVIQNGTSVVGTVELLNEETVNEDGNESFASKVRFNAAQPFIGQEVTLIVSNRVRSYADISMQDDFTETLTVKREVKQILVDSLMAVPYGKSTKLEVTVLPASASKGKMLAVNNSSTMILGVESTQVVIDNDGKAVITVSGQLPGTAALNFSVEGSDKTASTIASVEQTDYPLVASPTANIPSGTVVEKGTAIQLSCQLEGVTIYYTLDGSCPCNDTPSRKKYDGSPIIVNENMTIKAIAVAADMTESDIAEFMYIVEGTGIDDVVNNTSVEITPIPVREKLNVTAGGKMIRSVTVSSTNGVLVRSSHKTATRVTLDVSNISAGAYIVTVSTEQGVFSRKILKVE